MPTLSDQQRNLLSPVSPPAAPPTRNGLTVPTTNIGEFLNASCWAWALVGEYEATDNPFTAATIYNSDAGAFVFDANRVPTGLNAEFFLLTRELFPNSTPYYHELNNNFEDALGGDLAAQNRCRAALMKLTATVNGHTVLADDESDVYTMVMNTSVWYSWDHWGIGVKGADNGVISYQQTVPDVPLAYDCSVMWDEHQPLVTEIKLDGLLQTQVTLLYRVV